jgi:hypothetical protein
MLDEFGDRLVVAEHHMYDILDTPWTNDRCDLYGVVALPRVWFDGATCVGSVTSCSQAADQYRAAIQQRLSQSSPVEIRGGWARDDETILLTATFRMLDDGPLPEARAFLLVQENDIPFEGLVYDHVTRAAWEQPVVLAGVGDSVVVSAEIPLEDAWDPEQLQAIAFLQRIGETREVHQAARLPRIADLSFAFTDRIVSVPRGTGLASFHGTLANTGAATDTLTLALEDTFGWFSEYRVEGEGGYRIDPLTLALAPGATREVDLRTITDAEVRVGTAHLQITSQRSGRVHRARARVFNGSPAILLVDDDIAGTEETLVANALAGRGNLFDSYNVFVQHINEGPSAARLREYDVALWHTGWATYGLLTATDVAALTEFLDGGGALLLSSQQCLSELAPGTFTHDYLGLDGWTVNLGANAAAGVPDDPIGDGLAFALEYATQQYNRADDLAPATTATVFLFSEASRRIALRHENGARRTVFLAYGLNAMAEDEPDPNNPATVLDRALQWLVERPDVAVPDEAPARPASRICAIEPNPWTEGGRIRLRLSAAAARGGVRLEVFDVSGRRVRRLAPLTDRIGLQTVAWDGRDQTGRRLPAGLYGLDLSTADGRDRSRVVLLR